MWRFRVLLYLWVLGLSISTSSGNRRGTNKIDELLKKYPFNQYLLSNVPKPSNIIFPKQIRKNELVGISTKEFQISHHGTHDHYEHVIYQITIDGKKHKLRLQRNDKLLSAGINVKYYQDARQQVISQTVQHCYYQGTVKRDDWSAVAVSTCNGIRGIIQLHNETYIIQPLQGGGEGMNHPHIVYKATSSEAEKCGNDHGKWLPFHELHKGEYIKKLKFLNAQRSRRNSEDETEKFLKLALVLDNSVFAMLNLSEEQMVDRAIQTANIVDLYYKELKIRIALTYIEMWNKADRIRVSQQLRETLENFMYYQSKHLRDVDHHAAHLITAVDLEQNSVGMAIPDAVCTGRAVGVNKNPSVLEPQQGAAILSHMIGHNLGIKHDEDGGCVCSDEFGCIMSTEVLSTPEKHSRMFSSCSESDWDVSLSMGIAACLTENPQPTFPQSCGNRHVERGEECDCGSAEDCEKTDQCCDPNTCLLKYWAQCRSGACCHNCTYLSSSYMCRPQSTDCDVAEFCTGEDGECPANNYAKDGHPCGNNSGYCLGGICPTLDKQCQGIWGQEAVAADLQCFERFNPTGNFNGHCGKDDGTGSYAKCLPENIQCGLLHCDGGNKVPYYGPDKDSAKTTFTSNGKDFECKIVHGPAMLNLPHMGLVQDGTKCGEGKICMETECVPTTVLPPLNCPTRDSSRICTGHGICTKDDLCACDDGWTGVDCATYNNVTKVILSIETVIAPPVTTTTTDRVKVIPMDMTYSTARPTSTEMAAAVVQAEETSNLNTKWMVIILASVIGGLGLIMVLTFLCYWRRSPVKFNRDKKKKRKLFGGGGGDDSSPDNPNKLIKFGSLPSYKMEKNGKKGKRGKGKKCNEEDSDIGELPPPPVIIVDPDSAKPEKGILKNTFPSLKFANERRSSESNTATSENCDDSVDQYDDEDDTEAGEIQDILSGEFEPEQSLDALDNMVESSSFDFMLPPPFGNGNVNMFNRSPSPQRRFGGYDIPVTNASATRPNLWKSNLQSPPKARKLRMRNLDEILQQIDRHTIDLSPSPDDPPVQISPSTSEDVRSSSTDDRHYQTSSHDPQSPTSITSGSTCTALRPLLGSQWSKYVLHRNNGDNSDNFDLDDIESPLPHIKIPPPMNPINIRSIYNYGQTNLNRDNNDTPLGSQNGECSSNNGTANSRNGYEKSSGYGSEHDPERFSIEDISLNQSRSGSVSPPSFSAVIRTGPNQIKLVPASKLQPQGGYYAHEDELHKLLDGLPRIDAGCYERSPLSNVNSMTSTLETLKNSLPEYSSSEFNSNTNTLVNSQSNTLEKGEMEEKINNLEGGNKNVNEHLATNTLEMLKQSIPEYSHGHLPNPKPLGDKDNENNGSAPCIDRSLEEIPQAITDNRKSKKKRPNSFSRPVSLSVFKQQGSMEDENETEGLLSKRFSAIDKVPVEVCDC